MVEELELDNEEEKPVDQVQESEWEVLDDKVPFGQKQKEDLEEEGQKKETADEKTGEFDPDTLDPYQARRALFNTPKEEVGHNLSQEEKERLIGEKANSVKIFLKANRVLSDIDKLVGNGISEKIGSHIYVLRNHHIGKGRYYEVSVDGESVFYASEDRSSVFGGYNIEEFTDGEWSKELHDYVTPNVSEVIRSKKYEIANYDKEKSTPDRYPEGFNYRLGQELCDEKEGYHNVRGMKKKLISESVIHDADHIVDWNNLCKQLEEKGVHLERGFIGFNDNRQMYYMVNKNGGTVFYAAESSKHKVKDNRYKTYILVDGDWRKEIADVAGVNHIEPGLILKK